jgi:hypothetical protein
MTERLRIKYAVICKHPVKDCYVNGLHFFRVSETPNHSWYADAPRFGCSKDYTTPRRAIDAMVHDHGGTVVDVEPMGTF